MCCHEEKATKHNILSQIFSSVIKLSGSRCRIWCNRSRSSLLSLLALWVMAGVPSCLRVSATQRDDEDTIQDTLGRTLKTRDKWGHERGHRNGRECLLCCGCELCEDLSVYLSFYGDWLKQGSAKEPPTWGHNAAAPENQRVSYKQSVFLTTPSKHVTYCFFQFSEHMTSQICLHDD